MNRERRQAMAETNGDEGAEKGGKKSHPSRGKRYTPALKKEIIDCPCQTLSQINS
jgi:hypothetical protein